MEPWHKNGVCPEDPWEWETPRPRKRRHRPILTAVILSVVLAMAAVLLSVFLLIRAGGDHDALYDDPEALSGGNSYTAFRFANSRTGDRFSGSVGKFSGVRELFTCTLPEETPVEVRYSLEVTNGKAKLVLVDPAGNVTTLCECFAGESAGETVIVTLPPGTSRFKMAGAEEAAFSWEIE